LLIDSKRNINKDALNLLVLKSGSLIT